MFSWPRIIAVCVVQWALPAVAADVSVPLVHGEKGGLVYAVSDKGDRIPDFSYCGYMGGGEAVPEVATGLKLRPSGADDTRQIQAALDQLSAMSLSDSGWRGALQLSAEDFQVSGTLNVRGSRVVLRGSSDGARRTKIIATGKSRRPLIVVGRGASKPNESRTAASKETSDSTVHVRIAERIPVGSLSVSVTDVNRFEVDQRVRIVHPSSAEWIKAVGMNTFPSDDGRGSWLDWKPGALDQVWVRKIVAIKGEQIVLDAPLTSAIDPNLTPAFIAAEVSLPSATQVGVECLDLVSQVDTNENPKDEEHSWDGIRFLDVEDAWIRSVSFSQFAGSAVHLGRDTQRVTVADCTSCNPVSENAGWRRHTYYSLGQQTLFLRCEANDGRHDFAVGPVTTGPNAFVQCVAKQATEYSGPLGSWASGVLFDSVEIDGAGLALTNRETAAQGTGWAAANCAMWNCVAPTITCRKPPSGFNWAIGIWGEVVGDGVWRSLNEFATPESLYEAQLGERIGAKKAAQVLSGKVTVPNWKENSSPEFSYALTDSQRDDSLKEANLQKTSGKKLHLRNGWLTIGGEVAIGSRTQLSWWRGSVLEAKVGEFGSCLTRFVPGRDERGYTDPISEFAELIQARGSIALEHHWGLWYDRRRDDHQMVRRIDADAWPPFHEQPWARSGQGRAWDGLSKYDLKRFNPWYFNRLSEFADQADARGLILMHYMYFQHNILEAGAHWADFPWRPENCLQDTGFPEPPDYVNRKRVFMAEAFYDIEHPVRRDLHTRYIRHCLDTLGKHDNVLFVLGEEFTGPVHFVQFWLDTVKAWEQEKAREVLTVLSATRDVQEAILKDPKYTTLVDVIDVKYWWYTHDGGVFDPPGAQNLAPRQQLREWKGKKAHSPASVMRSIGEMRTRFPEKAVICSLPGVDGWAVLGAGGSLADVPQATDAKLRVALTELIPRSNHESEYALFDDRLLRFKVGTVDSQAESFVRINRASGLIVTTNDLQQDSKDASQAPVHWRPAE